MAGSFPGGVTAYTNPVAGDKTNVAVGGRTHSQFHDDYNDDLEAIMAKLGISAASAADDSPDTDQILLGTGSGRSKWGQITAGAIPSGVITAAMLADGTSAFKKIADTVLGSSTASISFTSIPATYRSLRLEWVARTDASASNALYGRFNNDTGNNYSYQILNGAGSGTSAFSGTAQSIIYLGEATRTASQAGEASAGWLMIPDYASTTFWKMTTGMNARDQEVYCTQGLWHSTSAINRVDFFANAGTNLIAGTRLTLWGLPA